MMREITIPAGIQVIKGKQATFVDGEMQSVDD